MYKILQEIRDILRAGFEPPHTAESGTTTTNIKWTAHGLVNGDRIINKTRSGEIREITFVDADNFTVETITGQTVGDEIVKEIFKYYYVGKVHKPAIDYTPVLMVYGNSTTLLTRATNKDTYTFNISIEIVTNAYNQIDAENDVENNDFELQAQKEIWEFMEKRDGNGIPIAESILGILRRNILGDNYLFNNNISIEYNTENTSGTVNYRGILTLDLTTSLNYRS